MILVISCGNIQEDLEDLININEKRKFEKTDPTFNHYVLEFQNKYNHQTNKEINISDIPVNFYKMEKINKEGVLGICYKYSNGDKEIIINKEWWNNHDECYRQVLINHELGHCALNRKHKSDVEDGVALSVMFQWL